MTEMRHFPPEIARLGAVAMADDDFAFKLGRKRGKDGKRITKYGGRILVAARLAGIKTGVRSRRFDGAGSGAARAWNGCSVVTVMPASGCHYFNA